MKKFTAVFCVLAIFCAFFCSCGKKDNSGSTSNNVNAEEIFAEITEKYKDQGHSVGVIVMDDGDTIAFELYEDVAPNTVNNFISLANSGFYDSTIFHRVIPNFMIQGGAPKDTNSAEYTIKGEFSNNDFENGIKHERGVMSMARQGNSFYPALAYNTAFSQFFIMVSDTSSLDGDYAAFGKVLEGMEVADKIVSVERDSNDKPLKEQKMLYVRVETYGVNYPEPETIVD